MKARRLEQVEKDGNAPALRPRICECRLSHWLGLAKSLVGFGQCHELVLAKAGVGSLTLVDHDGIVTLQRAGGRPCSQPYQVTVTE
jgi:hypothetical protein